MDRDSRAGTRHGCDSTSNYSAASSGTSKGSRKRTNSDPESRPGRPSLAAISEDKRVQRLII